MLVTRQHDTEQHHWSISKFEADFRKPENDPRMSTNFDGPLSTRPDWQGQGPPQYSFLPPGDSGIFSQPYDNGQGSIDSQDSQPQPRSAPAASNPLDGVAQKSERSPLHSPLGDRRSLDPLGLRQTKPPTPIQQQLEHRGNLYAQKAGESAAEDSLVSADTPGDSLASNPLGSVSAVGPGSAVAQGHAGIEEQNGNKEEEEDALDDEDMVDGDGDAAVQPQTAADRTAARRKMKRFR
jgi:hypothetical protein